MSKILDNRPAHVHINTIINIENWQLTCPYAPERTAYSVKLKVLIQNIIKNNLDISQIVDINKSRFSQSGKIIVLVWNICKSSATSHLEGGLVLHSVRHTLCLKSIAACIIYIRAHWNRG